MAQQLPQGYRTASSEDGRIFYINIYTNVSQWELPTIPPYEHIAHRFQEQQKDTQELRDTQKKAVQELQREIRELRIKHQGQEANQKGRFKSYGTRFNNSRKKSKSYEQSSKIFRIHSRRSKRPYSQPNLLLLLYQQS
jgi:hypothetical protein